MHKVIKNDDRGLSLVELLVAVAILAMVAIPLGRAFVTSAQTAQRNEAMGSASEAARNVSEAVAATSIADICFMMEHETALYGWDVAEAATYAAEGAAASASINSADPIYRFKLENVQYASHQYDALVTLRAAPAKNDAYIPQYTPIDAVFDQRAQQPHEPDAAANAYFTATAAALHGTAGVPVRTIALTLYGDETSVSANIAYNYTCTVTLAGDKHRTLDLSRSYSVVGESDNASDGKTPAVYIMYNRYSMQDLFTVNCTSGVTLPVFLAAQPDSGELPDGYAVSIISITGNADIYSNASSVTGVTAKKIYASERVDRLYDVTVQLYAAGSNDIIYTLDSSKMD